MSKDAFWFPHDSNAQHDERMLELRAEYGWEGYGVFWGLIERMRETQGYRLSMITISGLAVGMACPKPVLVGIIDLCCKHGLFSLEEESAYFYSPSLRRRMMAWDAKKAALSEAGKRGADAKQAKKHSPPPSQAEATLKAPLSLTGDSPSIGEDKTEEEIGEEKTRGSRDARPLNASSPAHNQIPKAQPKESRKEKLTGLGQLFAETWIGWIKTEKGERRSVEKLTQEQTAAFNDMAETVMTRFNKSGNFTNESAVSIFGNILLQQNHLSNFRADSLLKPEFFVKTLTECLDELNRKKKGIAVATAPAAATNAHGYTPGQLAFRLKKINLWLAEWRLPAIEALGGDDQDARLYFRIQDGNYLDATHPRDTRFARIWEKANSVHA